MFLALTDNTTSVTLSETAPVRGCTYFPSAPASGQDAGDITETAVVNLNGSESAIRAVVNAVEMLFDAAARQDGIHRAFVAYRPVNTDGTLYRSEVLSGRVEWSSNPGLRRIGDTSPFVQVAVIWTRRPFWEAVEEADAGTVHMTNGDVAGSLLGYWVGPAAPPTYSTPPAADQGDNAYNAGEWTNLVGVLPTPAHLRITNESGAAIAVKRVFVANDVYARFDGAQHQMDGGGAVTWTGASTHATPRWTLTPTAAQIAKLVAGGGVRLLAVMTSVEPGAYLRAMVQQVAGAEALPAWTGPEARMETGRFVYDLGYVQMPPGVTTFADWRIVLSVYSTLGGTAQVDFLQFCPGRDLIVLESAGVSWANGVAINWWGDERYAALAGYHASLRGVGQLLLQPARPNRLMVLVEGTTGVNTTAKLAVQVGYRPRRPTI